MARKTVGSAHHLPRKKSTPKETVPKARLDPVSLLARGLSARWIPRQSVLHILNQEEIDHDLRHMNAYYTTCLRYAQAAYVAQNRSADQQSGAANAGAAGTGSTSTVGGGGANNNNNSAPNNSKQNHLHQIDLPMPPLPIRLDPDHEKRVAVQRQKLAQAEVVREALEQEYVAIRAAYVETARSLQQLAQRKLQISEFLQDTVGKSKALQVAYLRARVQITRDVAAALKFRSAQKMALMQSGQDLPQSMGNTTPGGGGGGGEDPLMEVWTMVETTASEASAAGNATTKESKAPLKLMARTVPATIPGVPLLVSSLSNAPEKSVAWAFESPTPASPARKNDRWIRTKHSRPEGNLNSCPLVWMDHQVPRTFTDLIDDDDDHAASTKELSCRKAHGPKDRNSWLLENTQDGRDVLDLRREVQNLQKELEQESSLNAASLHQTTICRRKLDEWTSMIAMVRQETEACLYRHNILLSSNEIAPIAAQYWEEQEQTFVSGEAAEGMATQDGVAEDLSDEEGEDEEGESTFQQAPAEITTLGAVAQDDDENDGDDEGESGEEEDMSRTKRSLEEDETTNKKRQRKV